MNGINKVFLLGFLGADPEVQTSSNGLSYTRLRLATSRRRKDETGQWTNLTDWHRVTVWGKKGELCANFLQKGAPVAVEGHIEHYKPQQEGATTKLSIVAEEVHFLPRSNPSPSLASQANS